MKMHSFPTQFSPIVQITGGTSYLVDSLNQLLGSADLNRVRIAVSYVRWSGLGLLSSRLEAFLKRGGRVETVFGIANGVTTADSLLYCIYLRSRHVSRVYSGTIEDKYQNATFHSKFFEFRFETKTVVLIGSGNITGGGLANNTELTAQLEFDNKNVEAVEALDDAWRAFKALAKPITVEQIRDLNKEQKLGAEREVIKNRNNPKPFLKLKHKSAPKPFFKKIIAINNTNQRLNLLSQLDSLSEKPSRLYLQILEYETGAQTSGGAGYQVQLPVATLAAFFGVAPNETRKVTFSFGKADYNVSLTHFSNKTHRVRLLPVKNTPRPAIIVFERITDTHYACSIIPRHLYRATLVSKCTEQTRAGARRWGLG